MRHLPLLLRPAFAAASGLIVLTLSAQAQVGTDQPVVASTQAVAACERAARQALAAEGKQPSEVAFNAAPTVQPGLSSASQVVLRGVARWRAASGKSGGSGGSSVNYSCTVDLRTLKTVGLVTRDTSAVVAKAVPARPSSDPDLSHLSPIACESSAAAALKQRWPRVAQITFDTDTRRFVQASPAKAELHGRGRALPEPGAPSALFGFDCEIDPRDGRVLGTRLSA